MSHSSHSNNEEIDLDTSHGESDNHDGHVHPAPFYAEPIIDPQFFFEFRQTLDYALDGRNFAGIRGIADLEDRFRDLDRAARLARRMAAGDIQATASFIGWVQTYLRTHSDHKDSGLVEFLPISSNHQSNVINIMPVLDICVALAIWTHFNNQPALELLQQLIVPIGNDLQAINLLDRDLDDFRFGRTSWEQLVTTLDNLGNPKIPPIDPNLVGCLDAVVNALGAPGGTLSQSVEQLMPHPNTDRIIQIVPQTACAGTKITLKADILNPFDLSEIKSLGIFFAPCSRLSQIISASATEISVIVPNDAQTGRVYFAKLREVVEAEFTALGMAEASDVLASCFGLPPSHGGLMMGVYSNLPYSICSDAFIPMGSPNYVIVAHPPIINSLAVFDLAGNQLSANKPGKACETLILQWDIRSDDPSQATQIKIEIPGLQPILNASPSGQIRFTLQQSDVIHISATNGCDTTHRHLNVDIISEIKILPVGLIRTGVGNFDVIFVQLSCPAPHDIDIDLVSSDPLKVTVTPQTTIFAGQSGITVSIHSIELGNVGQPAATITASAPNYQSGSIEVWVGTTRGRWSVELNSPDSGLQPQVATVAVHAALLQTGEILLWSYDEDDWSNIDRGNFSVWDPITGAVNDAIMPRNLFCSGHCFLPDGRLFVAGGQSLSQTIPQVVFGTLGYPWGIWKGSDFDVHTFNPLTYSWSRHADMKGARWYPSCAVLPDGKVIIISGFWSHRHSIVNEDVEVFDPLTGTLTAPTKFMQDVSLYPFLFLLPGGALFVHSNRTSRVFLPDPSAKPPLNRTLSPHQYFTANPHTRNYPGAGACVLLPLDPDQGTKASILVFGGGGASPDKLNSTTPATSTAEIFTFDASLGVTRQLDWRLTRPLSQARFMCDGVLLPDGKVLAIGGVGVGTADNCSQPVLTAELYDPTTETWQSLAAMTVPRFYHQVALLLPDGRVMVAGSTGGKFHPDFGGGNLDEFRVEVFSPPYLFQGPRPQINFVPQTATWNSIMNIYADETQQINRAVLIKASSTTHQTNSDQRLIKLPIIDRNDIYLRVRLPPDATFAPPGWYLCFVLNQYGVPSEGKFIRIS